MDDEFGPRNHHRSCYTHRCPCGYLGRRPRECRCTPQVIVRYQEQISCPFLYRIDIQADLPRSMSEELNGRRPGNLSATVRTAAYADGRTGANTPKTASTLPVHGPLGIGE